MLARDELIEKQRKAYYRWSKRPDPQLKKEVLKPVIQTSELPSSESKKP